MEIKRFTGWLNEQAAPTFTKTGKVKDFAGNVGGLTAQEYFQRYSTTWTNPGDPTVRQPIVKKEGNNWYSLVSTTRRYMQADGKNVMVFAYLPGDQLNPVAEPKLAKQGGVLQPATQADIDKAKTNTTVKVTTDATGKTVSATAAKFSFNFDSGRYAMEDITPEKSTQLMKDLAPILSELATPRLANGKTEIVITASTSTLGVSANLKAQLAADGFPAKNAKYNGNDALCNARLATIETFIVSKFCEALKTTPEVFKTKVTITKNPLPNSGSGTTDEERKVFQYIAAEVKQTGEKIEPTQQLNCGANFGGEGAQAQAEANYVGFKKDLYVMASVGDKVTLSFDPVSIPDMVYFKYKDKEFLSPWLGAATGGNGRNFESELNGFADLEAKINAELAACGSKGTVATLAPSAKPGGKWKVQPGPGQGGKPQQFQFSFDKDFALDKLTVRCFSPLGGTVFKIKTECSKNAAAAGVKAGAQALKKN